MHPHLDALCRAPRITQMLDAVTECLGICHVFAGNATDTFRVNPVKLQRNTKGNGCQDGQLVCRINPLHIKGRVSLGITQLLCFFQHIGKVTPLVAHLGKDEIAGAVNNAGEPLDFVGREALTQRLDNGNTAGDRRLKGHHDTLVLCCSKNLVAMHGNQRLVGRHHVLAVGDGLQHQFACRFITTNEFNNYVDIRVLHERKCVITNINGINPRQTARIIFTCRGMTDDDATTGTPGDFICIAV